MATTLTANPAAAAQAPLLAAPHRMFFLGGALQAVLAFAWWAWELAARAGLAAPLALPWPPGWLHAAVALYGVFPFFAFGFLMTAMPRWQGAADIPRRTYVATASLFAAGWLLCYGAAFWPPLATAGMILVLAAWIAGVAVLAPVAWRESPDRRHALVTWWALVAGIFGIGLLLLVLLTGSHQALRGAVALGSWGVLFPLFVGVCHRMVPFFSSSVLPKYEMYRPMGLLYLLLAAAAAHGTLQFAGLDAWYWTVDLPAAAVALRFSWRWQFRRSFAVRLLAMLHIGFLWLSLALLLSAGQSMARLAGVFVLGLAPLHALTIGFYSVILLGMASRVSLGHSGRPLAADRLVWWTFIGLQGVAVLRVGADVFPGAYSGLLLAAAAGWLVLFGIWGGKFAPLYLRPRADGKPG